MDDSEQTTGRHAAPKLPLAGSATVRALLALGALLSAIGISIGRADAVRSHQTSEEQADPEAGTTLDDGDIPAETPRAVAVPPVNAAHWAPTVRSARSITYTPSPAPGPGRHRKPAAEHLEPTGPVTPSGRHRRTSAPTHENGHVGGHRPARRSNGAWAA